MAIRRGDVRLHPNDGLNPRFLRLFLEFPRSVEVAVVGDGERRLLELLRAANQIINPVRSIEERVLGVAMEMDEGHLEEVSRRRQRLSKAKTVREHARK
jgi:hypothetical protein